MEATKIAAVCVTYNRPKLLGRMIRCFERQDYPHRELVILDDAGQYHRAQGDRWTLVTTDKRFSTLGEKRNAAARLVSPDARLLAVWDDDDLYLPWALTASVAALQEAALSRPSLVLHPDLEGRLHQHETGGLFHSGWAYHRQWFWRVRGYPEYMSNGEDQQLFRRFERVKTSMADPIADCAYQPFLVYPWETSAKPHLSGAGPRGYENWGMYEIERGLRIEDYIANPPLIDLANPKIMPGVNKRKF